MLHSKLDSVDNLEFGEKAPSKLKKILKNPLGKVYSEEKIVPILKRTRKRIIAVGDESGHALISWGIKPFLWIYDGKIMRKPISYELPLPSYFVKNKKSSISKQLKSAIDDSISSKRSSRIFVLGEEDMAALYAIYKAKKEIVIYGQPKQGMVLVEPTPKSRQLALRLLNMLE